MFDPLERRSASGMIETGAHATRLHPSFAGVLEAAVAAFTTIAPEASLYIYGSVATGQAVVPRSDVDLLSIGATNEQLDGFGTALSARFDEVCRGVEVGSAMPGDFDSDGDEAYGNRAFLRHYCVRLTGSDRNRPTHDFLADARAARGFNGDIARHARRWRTDLDMDANEPVVVARRIARKTLLAVAGLVSVHDTTWTTDRATAARRWADIEPDRTEDLGTLLHWSERASGVTAVAARRMLDDTVDALVDHFADLIGLWPDVAV